MNKLRDLLRKIPNWIEFVLVLSICFGMSIVGSIFSFVSGAAFTRVEFTNAHAVGILVLEPLLAAICVVFLYLRGNKLWKKLRFSPTWKATGVTFGLLIATYIAYVVNFNIVYLLVGKENLTIAKYSVSANVLLILAVSLLNPLFEEAFVVGYVFDKMQNYGVVFVVAVSTLIRVSYHLYQGWIGIISIVPLGILFAIVYSRTRNLMPLYFAHAVMDLIGLILQSNQ